MKSPFRLYGSELSPYSIKVRSYLRFKKLEHEWLPRSNARQEEFQRYAKLPLIPVLVDADDASMQDSTPIIETLESFYPDPSITPEEPALGFMSALLEDYADEWLNKAMFHYRWSYPEDQDSAARRIADAIFEGGEKPEGVEAAVKARMIGRLHYVGSSPTTAPVIEASFARALAMFERMLAARAYLFGGRPSLADFGLAGQFATLLSDPTPGALMKAQAPNVVRWVARMENPDVEGGFVPFGALREELADLLRSEVAGAYLPWMDANARAVADDENSFSVEIGGAVFEQKPQRYAAKALAEIRRKRAAVSDEGLAALLAETGCDVFLRSAEAEDGDEEQGERYEEAPGAEESTA